MKLTQEEFNELLKREKELIKLNPKENTDEWFEFISVVEQIISYE